MLELLVVRARSGWWVALWLAGCASGTTPAVERPGAAPIVVAPPAPAPSLSTADAPEAAATQAPEATKPPTAAAPAAVPYVPGPERRINWFGLSLDLNDIWNDETNYAFESSSESIQHLVFEPSELQPAQVRPWLQEVRRRVEGAFGAKSSGVQAYENPSFFVLGVQIRFNKESLYDLFVPVDERVVGITARCRSECDAALRGIVRSLKKHTSQGTGPAQKLKGAQRRYTARGLVFDSSMVFTTPNEFTLQHADVIEERIFCKRTSEPPADAELPPEVHWSYDATQELAKVARTEETLTGKSSDARAAVVRLYRREATASDGGRDNIPFSSNSAVVSIGSEVLHCYQLAGPTSAGLMARFHRLFESARYE